MTAEVGARGQGIVRLGLGDSLTLLGDVVLPTLAKGVLIRRPRVVALAERLDADGRAVRRLQKLRARHGPGPLVVPVPGRPLAVVLDPGDLRRILAETPDPFSAATREKKAALAHFEPHVSLGSDPPERSVRKRVNDEALESGRPSHSGLDLFAAIVGEEVEALLANGAAELAWPAFTRPWHRLARRVALGDGARDDDALTDALAKLRAAGNWAFAHPGRPRLRERFRARLAAHLDRAEPGSLAAIVMARAEAGAEPVDQVTHWLFAFDAAGIATWRALALLASHPEAARSAETEAAGGGHDLPFLRAAILESVRLWPTTPAILRETIRDVPFSGGVLAKGTHVLLYVPFFGRDDESLPEAHRFAPELWLEPGRTDQPLIPFSAGPGTCPAHRLVPALGALVLGSLLARREVALRLPPRLRPSGDLPGTLDPFTLSFELKARPEFDPRSPPS